MNLLLIFVLLNIVNVVIQTTKSIVTIKCGKVAAALVNALAYGIYTVVLVYMSCDLSLAEKVITVAGTNFVGVFIVKWIEEKMRKDKLWKVEFTVPVDVCSEIDAFLSPIPHSHMIIDTKHILYNCYCATQKESEAVKEIINRYNAKFFVSESKSL